MKTRSKVLSILFSLICPGLGHIYNGQLIVGIIIMAIFIIGYFIFPFLTILKSFYGLLTILIIFLLALVLIALHSFILSRNNSSYKLQKFNKAWVYILCILVFHGIRYLPSLDLPFRTFNIPTAGMEYTLEVGDFIMAEMKQYDISQINRGDVVIFTIPESENELYTKRVIGLSGETIQISDKQIFINGNLYLEDIPNIRHIEYSYDYDFNNILVPRNEIYLMGDFRDNSNDSRYFGPVPIENVVGKPLYIYYSDDFSRIGTKIN